MSSVKSYGTSSSSSPLIQPVSTPEENEPLLESPLPELPIRMRIRHACISPKHLCLPSKAAALILLWSAIVGTTFTFAMDTSVALGVAGKRIKVNGHKYNLNIFINILVPYACLALVMLIYPLSGFVADICCGRYKTVIGSFCLLVCSCGAFTIGCILAMTSIDHKKHIPDQIFDSGKYVLVVIALVAFLLFTIGLSGFQANYIQLGLQQLNDAPSEYLGLFIHWAIWTFQVAAPLLHTLFVLYACSQSKSLLYALLSLPPLCFVILLSVLIFSCSKKHWFYSEPGQHNPYTTVARVLNFARKHKSPLQRSAFTYHYSERPTSRIDLAKERYGGPFTTEQVEDVKSFLRILGVLIALGPIFILEVPVSYFVFPAFTLHTGMGPVFKTKNCTAQWIILESGTLGQFCALFLFPVYIWFIYGFLRRCIPRILVRLFVGVCLLFLGVVSMFATDLLGHFTLNLKDPSLPSYYNKTGSSYCMFDIDVTRNHVKSLRLHWGFHVVPNLLIGFSPLLISTSTFEFISAQSPHSMKGLLVGVFFAIKGLFQLSSAILLVPFSLPHKWTQGQFVSNPKAINCDFGYFLTVCVLAFMGMILFLTVAKCYRYRERDDPPFNQAIVEEVFAKNVEQNRYQVYSPDDPTYSDSW